MKTKDAKKVVKQFQQNIASAGRKVEHMRIVIDGFNELIEKKVVKITPSGFYLYPELLTSDPQRAGAWMHNAYIYCRMKLKYPEGTTILFKHIETGATIGRYEGGKVEMG